jgi:putative exporter of polyketide antibiotics
VLAIALPLFLVFGFPMLGYAVCAGAWLAGRAIHLAAERHARSSLRGGNRRAALGTMGAATLGRVWLVALAILLVGLADRKAGLAGAVLAAVVVTVYFAAQGLAYMLEPEESRNR